MPRQNAARQEPPSRESLVTLNELAAHLRVHVTQVLRHVAAGMPAVDLSAVHRPGRRRKRLLRFDVDRVEEWLAQRSAR